MADTSKRKTTDRHLVIAGAGAAGLSAAIRAAEAGMRVDLLERENSIGGTVVKANLHTLGGFLTEFGDPVEAAICKEFIARAGSKAERRRMGKVWVLQMRSEDYVALVQQWIRGLETLRVHPRTSLKDLRTENGLVSSSVFPATDYVDATGNAELLSVLDKYLPKQDPEENSFAFTLQVLLKDNVKQDLAARVAMKAELEKAFAAKDTSVWIDTGFTPDELFVKVNCDKQIAAQSAMMLMASALNEFLPVANIKISKVCNRAGARARAPLPSSENTFLVHWPFEQWRGAKVQLDSPLRMPISVSEDCLRVEGFANLFAIGKCAGIPAPEASAARVVGSCWTMGERLVTMMIGGRA